MSNTEQPSHYIEHGDKNIHVMLGFLQDGKKGGCDNCIDVTTKGINHCFDSGCFDRQIFGD